MLLQLNQDRGCVTYPVRDDHASALVAVFDGHGEQGQRVSEYAIIRLAELIQAKAIVDTDPAKALSDAFVRIDGEVLASKDMDTSESGTTACAMYFCEDQLWTATLGDSRAVAGIEVQTEKGAYLQSYRLTEDQKPEDKVEMERITRMGGFVQVGEKGESGRVYQDSTCEEGGLAVSRAIGDHSLASVGVVAEPEIRVHQIGKDMKCIVVASDGLWEYVSDQDAINIVSTNGSASRAAAALLDEAIAKWTKKGGGYQDDITIGVLYLPLWKEGVNANKPVAPVRALQTPPKPVVAPVIAPVVPPVAVPVPAKTELPKGAQQVEQFKFKADIGSDDSDDSDDDLLSKLAPTSPKSSAPKPSAPSAPPPQPVAKPASPRAAATSPKGAASPPASPREKFNFKACADSDDSDDGAEFAARAKAHDDAKAAAAKLKEEQTVDNAKRRLTVSGGKKSKMQLANALAKAKAGGASLDAPDEEELFGAMAQDLSKLVKVGTAWAALQALPAVVAGNRWPEGSTPPNRSSDSARQCIEQGASEGACVA